MVAFKALLFVEKKHQKKASNKFVGMEKRSIFAPA
jgi:hypothetical protein